MQCYLTHYPYAILDGLFRVDVMQTEDKEYVVNEFERPLIKSMLLGGRCSHIS